MAAEVLSVSGRPEGQAYYPGSPLKRSSTSYTSFVSASPSSYTSTGHPPPSPPSRATGCRSQSLPSSAQTSLTDLSQPSSTPASSFSFDSANYYYDGDDDDDDDDDELSFPSYDDGVRFFHQDEPLDLPSPKLGSEGSTPRQGSCSESTSTISTRSDSPLPTPIVVDDTAVKQGPSRHVDYLSHDWREEDIWSSWRHIVSQRKVYGQRSRLENASWRTWAKSKYHLSTISPETLNWLKESDVTWLYGPLQPAMSHPVTHACDPSPRQLTRSSSFVAKKPILKKRSMSEVMLQRSLSASSLVKQAAASVQAQQTIPAARTRPALARALCDFVAPSSSIDAISRGELDYFSSRTDSNPETPVDGPKRHIRFDDKVEQCIAVDCKDCDFDDDGDSEEEDDRRRHGDDSDPGSSDDGVVMMRRPRNRRVWPEKKDAPGGGTPLGRIIEKLPDTTLKYRTGSPEITRQPPTPFARSWSSGKLALSSSQETLRPTFPSRNFLLGSDDDEGDNDGEEASFNPSGAFSTRRDSVAVTRSRAEGKRPEGPQEDERTPVGVDVEGTGLRRTPSGMFMPYEEDEDDMVAAQLGLLGKVSDTINTARDIAHVIWNVGWRK